MPATTGGFLCLLVGLSVAISASGHAAALLRADAERQLGGEASPLTETYVSTYEIIETFDHDPNAFTQGLTFDASGQYLYASNGLYRESRVRKLRVGLERGKVVLKKESERMNEAPHFAEGIAIVHDKLVQLTWREKTVNEFSLDDLSLLRSVKVDIGREGWGAAYDGTRLYVTDSTEHLYHVDPSDYSVIAKMAIVDKRLTGAATTHTPWYPGAPSYAPEDQMPIYGVNELELVEGELWGNVFPMYQHSHSECIVRINATNGHVLGWVDMGGLFSKQRREVVMQPGNYVLNGIAYHPDSKRLYVTGKKWDHMYQVRVVPKRFDSAAQEREHVLRRCGLGGTAGAARRFG